MGGRGEKLDKFAAFLEPKTEEEMSSAKLKLLRAGYRGKHAVRSFHAIQFVLGVSFLLLGAGFVLYKSTTGEIGSTELALFGVGPGIAGYFLPRYWVERRVQMRQQEIQDGFPDALDMLLVCVEAGQSLDQGIVRVAREIAVGYPALAEELSTVSAEVKAGKEKTSVLRAFAERAGVQDVSSFVTVMIQSQTFGTSIAEALRVYARIWAGQVQYALAQRDPSGALRLAAWRSYSDEPVLSWTASNVDGGWVIDSSELR